MIKEALQYLVKLGNTDITTQNGQTYSSQPLHLVPESTATAIQLNSLKGIVDYLTSEFDGNEDLILHIVSPTEVRILSGLTPDKRRSKIV